LATFIISPNKLFFVRPPNAMMTLLEPPKFLRKNMITREELINDPENWITTEKLDLDFFDHIKNDLSLGDSYYLKLKGDDRIYYGQYIPESKSFRCNKLKDHNHMIRKREEVSSFISLPPLHFDLTAIIR
jgi:hypothetical protein